MRERELGYRELRILRISVRRWRNLQQVQVRARLRRRARFLQRHVRQPSDRSGQLRLLRARMRERPSLRVGQLPDAGELYGWPDGLQQYLR